MSTQFGGAAHGAGAVRSIIVALRWRGPARRRWSRAYRCARIGAQRGDDAPFALPAPPSCRHEPRCPPSRRPSSPPFWTLVELQLIVMKQALAWAGLDFAALRAVPATLVLFVP